MPAVSPPVPDGSGSKFSVCLFGLPMLVGALFAGGCATLDPLQPPKLVFALTPGEGAPAPAMISARGLREELQETSIAAAAIGPHAVNDNNYVVLDHAWFNDTFLPFYVHLKTSLDLRHVNEGFDCDNFAALLKQQLVLANRRGGFATGGEVPCATMKVQQLAAFGSVPSLGEDFHSLNLIRTNRGWFVVEPQDGLIEPLGAYPNRDRIVDLYF